MSYTLTKSNHHAHMRSQLGNTAVILAYPNANPKQGLTEGCGSRFRVRWLGRRSETGAADGHVSPGMIGRRPPRLARSRRFGRRMRLRTFGLGCAVRGGWRRERLRRSWTRSAVHRCWCRAKRRCCACWRRVAQSGARPRPSGHYRRCCARRASDRHAARPVHATAFQAGFDYQFVAALHRAIANGPAGGLKGRILHMGRALFQIGHVGGPVWLVGMQRH